MNNRTTIEQIIDEVVAIRDRLRKVQDNITKQKEERTLIEQIIAAERRPISALEVSQPDEVDLLREAEEWDMWGEEWTEEKSREWYELRHLELEERR